MPAPENHQLNRLVETLRRTVRSGAVVTTGQDYDAARRLRNRTSDPVAFALTMNAITHHCPADPGAVPNSICDEELMPGVDPHTYESDLAAFTKTSSDNIAGARVVPTEPALKSYVFARY